MARIAGRKEDSRQRPRVYVASISKVSRIVLLGGSSLLKEQILTSNDSLGPAHILVVDDRPDCRLVMETVLGDSPEYKITMATSGQEAIDLVKANDFALILLDLQMPGMDGYETATHIKRLENGKDVPIIMVTAIYKEDPDILKGYSVGALDYIGKPFNPDIVKAKVAVYANLYRSSRQLMLQNKYLTEAKTLLSNEHISKAAIETLPVGVVVTDKTGTITQINKEANKIWGGTKLVDLEHYNEYVGWWAESGKAIGPEEWALARAIQNGETSQYEIINIQGFDGVMKTILNSAAPVIGANGEVLGAVDVMQVLPSKGKWKAA